MDPTAYTIEEVAKRLRVSPSMVKGMIRAGELRAVRLGPKTRRIDVRDLTAYLDKLRDDPDADEAGA